MDIKVKEIQNSTPNHWIRHESHQNRDALSVPPVRKMEGSMTRKIDNKEAAPNDPAAASDQKPGDMKDVVDEVQSYLQDLSIDLKFRIEDKTNDVVVQVLNRETGELIRQLPPETVLKIREKLEELRGVLFDSKA